MNAREWLEISEKLMELLGPYCPLVSAWARVQGGLLDRLEALENEEAPDVAASEACCGEEARS